MSGLSMKKEETLHAGNVTTKQPEFHISKAMFRVFITEQARRKMTSIVAPSILVAEKR